MSGRKSSIDPARRLSQRKAYIPYRDYDPDVGKRTGVVVRRVERHSDGFEPFDDVLDQADVLTPPPKSRPNKRKISIIADEFDENGEMSMDIDSPQPIFATTGLQQSPSVPIPSTSRRKAMTIRDLDDSSQDMEGSPHHVTHDDGADDELNLTVGVDQSDYGMDVDTDGDDNPIHQNHAPSSVTRRKSFSQINSGNDDDDEDEDELLSNKPPSRKPPPGGKPPSTRSSGYLSSNGRRPQDDEEEREVAHGLDDIPEEDEEGEEEDHQQEQESEEPPLKKARTKTLVETLTRRKKENRPVPEGVRRSQRESIRPLEWWRGEKYVYGRVSGSGRVLTAPIKEIVRIPKEPPRPLAGRHRRKPTSRAKSKSEVPEEGWDDETSEQAVVLDVDRDNEEVNRRITCTARNVQLQPVANGEWRFHKIFSDSDFIAAGQMVLPPLGRKPSKRTRDNTYVFYVIEGAINLRVHATSMILAQGAMFMVPRGNTYMLENLSERETRLFFAQARKVKSDDANSGVQYKVSSRGGSGVQSNHSGAHRSSSAAAAISGARDGDDNEDQEEEGGGSGIGTQDLPNGKGIGKKAKGGTGKRAASMRV